MSKPVTVRKKATPKAKTESQYLTLSVLSERKGKTLNNELIQIAQAMNGEYLERYVNGVNTGFVMVEPGTTRVIASSQDLQLISRAKYLISNSRKEAAKEELTDELIQFLYLLNAAGANLGGSPDSREKVVNVMNVMKTVKSNMEAIEAHFARRTLSGLERSLCTIIAEDLIRSKAVTFNYLVEILNNPALGISLDERLFEARISRFVYSIITGVVFSIGNDLSLTNLFFPKDRSKSLSFTYEELKKDDFIERYWDLLKPTIRILKPLLTSEVIQAYTRYAEGPEFDRILKEARILVIPPPGVKAPTPKDPVLDLGSGLLTTAEARMKHFCSLGMRIWYGAIAHPELDPELCCEMWNLDLGTFDPALEFKRNYLNQVARARLWPEVVSSTYLEGPIGEQKPIDIPLPLSDDEEMVDVDENANADHPNPIPEPQQPVAAKVKEETPASRANLIRKVTNVILHRNTWTEKMQLSDHYPSGKFVLTDIEDKAAKAKIAMDQCNDIEKKRLTEDIIPVSWRKKKDADLSSTKPRDTVAGISALTSMSSSFLRELKADREIPRSLVRDLAKLLAAATNGAYQDGLTNWLRAKREQFYAKPRGFEASLLANPIATEAVASLVDDFEMDETDLSTQYKPASWF